MAEFCLDCWNKMNGSNDTEEDYILSEYPYLCEGCEQCKNVIIKKKGQTNGFYGLLSLLFGE